jgi:thioredoxin-related protein
MNQAIKTAAAIAVLAAAACVQATPVDAENFEPFHQWMAAVLTNDAAALKAFYSTNPPAKVRVKTLTHDADADISFWLEPKVLTMKAEIIRGTLPKPGIAHLILHLDIVTAASGGKQVSITDDQVWQQQGSEWRIVSVERTDAPQLKQPSDMKKNIYPDNVDAHTEIKEAQEKAAKENKRLLLVFGANWCFDCHVLDIAFHSADLAPIVEANYELVHVDLGPDGKKNADLVKQYEIPLDKGIPAMAILDSTGNLVVSQKNGEVEDARQLTPAYLEDFLNKWKPGSR